MSNYLVHLVWLKLCIFSSKVIMQGKLIAVAYTLRSLWAEFVNKNRCISVRLVSEEVNSIKFQYIL